jgi:flagellar biogenesis protein FliO
MKPLGSETGGRIESVPGQKRARTKETGGSVLESQTKRLIERTGIARLTGWLVSRLRRECPSRPELAVLERITLAPRQSLALIEAGGERFLVATSADGTPAFCPVGGKRQQPAPQDKGVRRVSW